MFPRTRSGRASLLPPVPWHYSGQMLTLEYRSDPEAVAELLPSGRPPVDEDPVEELTRLEPREVIAGCWREVARSWRSGTTLKRNNLSGIGESRP